MLHCVDLNNGDSGGKLYPRKDRICLKTWKMYRIETRRGGRSLKARGGCIIRGTKGPAPIREKDNIPGSLGTQGDERPEHGKSETSVQWDISLMFSVRHNFRFPLRFLP